MNEQYPEDSKRFGYGFYVIISCMFCSGFCGIITELSLFTLSESLIGGTTTDLLYTMGVMMFFMGVGALFVSSRLFKEVTFEKFIAIELLISLITMFSIPGIFFLTSISPAYTVWYFILFSAIIGGLIGMEIPLIQKLIDKHYRMDIRLNSSLVMMMDYFGSIVAFYLFSKLFLVMYGLPYSAFIGGVVNLIIAMLMIGYFFPMIRFKKNTLLFTLIVIGCSVFYYFSINQYIAIFKQKLFRNKIIEMAQTPYQEIILTDNSKKGSLDYEKKFKSILLGDMKEIDSFTLTDQKPFTVELNKNNLNYIPYQVLSDMNRLTSYLLGIEKSADSINTITIANNFNKCLLLKDMYSRLKRNYKVKFKESKYQVFEKKFKYALTEDEIKKLNRLLLNELFSPWLRMQDVVKEISIKKLGKDYSLFINGGLQFSTHDEYMYHEFIAHTPFGLKSDIKNVLIMGGGDGLAIRELNKNPNIVKMILVDIDPKMTNLFRTHEVLKKINKNAFDDKRLTVVNEDAFRFARNCKEKFDLILLDFPDPHHSQTAKLYTIEMFSLLKNLMVPDAVLISQSGSPIYDQYAYQCIRKTFNHSGFHVSSHHIEMESFLQWGFQICSLKYTEHEIKKILLDFKEPVKTRWLDKNVLRSSMLWSKEFWSKYDKIPSNSFLNLPLVVLYNKDNFFMKYYLEGKWSIP
ncbi:MAG: hypothetical protein COA79_00585 [Planctomycetota bacterium]|nr:MAG: hypothetical protein COA79_00585 [Planctomycetota bacterium]